MAVSKANQRAVNKYVKANYDRVNVTMPKGRKAELQAHADTQGQSVNAYINTAIDSRIAQEAAGAALGCGVVFLPSKALKTAQNAAEAAGEGLPQFIGRAVETQAQRDALARKMKGGKPNE